MEKDGNKEKERLTGGFRTSEEIPIEEGLRPRVFEEYYGQTKVVEKIRMYIDAARLRNEALDHILFYGPPGLGKTTLAYLIARDLNVNLRPSSGPLMEKAGDLAGICTSLQEKDVLFIDEIHRLNPAVEEVLYPAMEDYKLDIVLGQGPSARGITIPLPHFTLIGATTRAGLLTSPLRERFGIVERLEYYSVEELVKIVKRSASILNIMVDDDGALEIASRSRGTPRIANRFVKRVRDYAQVRADGRITLQVASDALSMMEIDEKGLDKMDRHYLLTIIKKFDGGPVGLDTLSAAMHEEKDTLEDVYEPYLMEMGFIKRTPRGRVATRLSFDYFNIPLINHGNQGELFQ